MNLSPHFELDELVRSETATRKNIDNTPPQWVVDNLTQLCTHILEPLRSALGVVQITSGYRCAALNQAIGGSKTSSHMEGKAADLSVKGKSLAEVFNWIQAHAQELRYDQLIREFPPGGWIHASFDPAKNRRENLLARTISGRTEYSAQNTPVAV